MNLRDLRPNTVVALRPTPSGPRPITLNELANKTLQAINAGASDAAATAARDLLHHISNVVGFRKF